MDKCKGICKALKWRVLPEQDEEAHDGISAQEYKNHEAWSQFLENEFGTRAAMSFAAGSDILLDHINEDLTELLSVQPERDKPLLVALAGDNGIGVPTPTAEQIGVRSELARR